MLNKNQTFNTPILFLIFNRPDLSKEVFQAIKKIKPQKLYVASDGPRIGNNGEAEVVKDLREFVKRNIDWNCELKTLFREENLGCKIAVSEAIEWFFASEEKGIILEDDCLPNKSFFEFCDLLLNKYKNDTRIGQICGFNPIVEFASDNDSYVFSRFGPIWGWATWRRVWKNYELKNSSWSEFKDRGFLKSTTETWFEEKWRLETLDQVFFGTLDTWDYQWAFTLMKGNYLSIVPCKNLIKNIGFGESATHTKGSIKRNLLTVFELEEINHPNFIFANRKFDSKVMKEFIGLNFKQILIRKFRAFIKRVNFLSFFQKFLTKKH